MADPPGVDTPGIAAQRRGSTRAEVVLGVDFGTSYTSAGAMIDGRVDLIRDNGDPVIPSVVYVPARGEPIVGARALTHAFQDPQHTVCSVKRLLGERHDAAGLRRLAPLVPYPLVAGIGGRVHLRLHHTDWAAEQIAAAVLGHVRELAERRFGPVRKVVLAVAAEATLEQRQALLTAARLARLEVIDLVPEPVAGALALGLHARPEHRRVVVCDFGGGTFDVTLVEQTGTRFHVVATGGDPYLGGDDLDQAMAQHLGGLIFRRSGFDVTHDLVRRTLLARRCEGAKRVLSTQLEARLTMRDAFIERGERRDLDVVLERSWCEALWEPLLDRALAVVEQTVARSGWRDLAIDEVGLIGGTSLVPRFQQRVRARFAGTRLTLSEDAHVAVATGAALVAARHSAVTLTHAAPS